MHVRADDVQTKYKFWKVSLTTTAVSIKISFLSMTTASFRILISFSINIELCGYNLRQYIDANKNSIPLRTESIEIFHAALQDRLKIPSQIIDGLCYIHAQEKVHGDLKPKNNIITRFTLLSLEGLFGSEVWKIAGLGISGPGTLRRLHHTPLSPGTMT